MLQTWPRPVGKAGLLATAGLLAILALSGCQTVTTSTTGAMNQASPAAKPAELKTGFSDALDCMDNLFVEHGVRNILVTAQDIPDQTQSVAAGTKDMLISAVSSMSERSNAVRFVAFGSDIADIMDLHGSHGKSSSFVTPDFFMRGSISQLDEAVSKASTGASVSTPVFNLGAAGDQITSMISVDLNVGCVKNLQIVPGLTSSNSIAVINRAGTAEAGGILNAQSLSPISINVNLGVDHNEGKAQAVRTLIQLAVIELMGRLSGVPYRSCLLPGDKSDLAAATMSRPRNLPCDVPREPPRIAAPAPAKPAAKPAAEPNPPAQTAAVAATPPAASSEPSTAGDGWRLTTDAGADPTVAAGDTATLLVSADSPLYLTCFYRQADQSVLKIFPNRFSQQRQVSGDSEFTIPSPEMPFQFRFDAAGESEEFRCFASEQDLSERLPGEIADNDLVPIAIGDLDSLSALFAEASDGTAEEQSVIISIQ